MQENIIKVSNLSKSFDTTSKSPGLKATIKHFFKRETKRVNVINAPNATNRKLAMYVISENDSGHLVRTNDKIKTLLDFPNRKSGCAALDMAYVAAGRYDGYFQKNLNLWDIAAGIILVKEAGGIINEIDLNKTNNINVIATSSNISAKFQEKLIKF